MNLRDDIRRERELSLGSETVVHLKCPRVLAWMFRQVPKHLWKSNTFHHLSIPFPKTGSFTHPLSTFHAISRKILDVDSIFGIKFLISSLSFITSFLPQAFLKTKCAECGGSCGLAKKYKETMAVAWRPMIFAVFLVMGDFLLDDNNEIMKQKHEHQKASVGLLSVILFWELGFRMRFGPHLSQPFKFLQGVKAC